MSEKMAIADATRKPCRVSNQMLADWEKMARNAIYVTVDADDLHNLIVELQESRLPDEGDTE